MSDDHKDFLERREARRRRMQQRQKPPAPAKRSPLPADAGNKAARRPPADQARPAARGKPGKAQPAGPSLKKRQPASPIEQEINTTPSAAPHPRAERLQSAKQPLPPRNTNDPEERSLAGGLEGRRTAARREEAARLATNPSGPKPPLLSRLILGGTAAICGLLLLATLGEAWTVHRLKQQITANQQAVDQLQAQNQQLSGANQQLQQPSTIEEEARKLGFIFPGDQPVVVATSTPPAPTTRQAAPSSPNWWGFWPDWLKYFLGG